MVAEKIAAKIVEVRPSALMVTEKVIARNVEVHRTKNQLQKSRYLFIFYEL